MNSAEEASLFGDNDNIEQENTFYHESYLCKKFTVFYV